MTTIYLPRFSRGQIASLAPEVLAACAEAPETGKQLLIPAGAALADTVAAVARSLGWTSGMPPLRWPADSSSPPRSCDKQ